VGFATCLGCPKPSLGGGAYMDGPVAAMLQDRTSRGQIDGSPARLDAQGHVQCFEELVRGLATNDEIAAAAWVFRRKRSQPLQGGENEAEIMAATAPMPR